MKPIASSLLRDQAYENLRDAIVGGELLPGAALRVETLAAQLELSTMPIREALARLRDEGLVEIRPRSGTRVAPLALDLVSQALAVITAMHELAVRTATPRLKSEDLTRLSEAAVRFAAAVEARDEEVAIAEDEKFHGLFVEVAANRALSETLERYSPLLRRAEAMRFATLPGRSSIDAHARILEAARRGDADAASRFTRENWDSLRTQIDLSLEEENGDQRESG
jgi:DNA-binding GntR family transcriptional regulator